MQFVSVVVGDRDSLIGRNFDLEDQVTTLLTDDAVAPIATCKMIW